MRILITGINGFVGSHLSDYLDDKGEIFGTIRRRSNLENLEKSKATLIECDLRDSHSINKLIKDVKPDKIFHLAAQSFVPSSWKVPSETLETNIMGQMNLLEAVREAKINPVIQIACSSEEYGLVYSDELPIKEDQPLRPLSPYAVSKVAQDLMGYQYFKSYGMKIIRTRAFNHSGARRPADFVDSGFAKQIVEGKVIKHGNLDAIRDFTDVRDVVRAYWLLSENDYYGDVFNICSGKGYKISEVLDLLIKCSGLQHKTVQDESKMRPSDVPVLIGDNTKIRKLGWEPQISYEETLFDMLNYWREKL